jgi:tetratricopeptide (TPR) repeat protein
MRRTLLLACTAALLPVPVFAYINAGFRSEKECQEYLKKHEQERNATEAIRRDPRDAVAYFTRGRICANQNRDGEALADFDKAIELDPGLAGPHFLRGKILWGRGQKARAMTDLEKAVELNPKWVEAQVFFAVHTDDPARAIKAAKAACEEKKYKDDICLQLLAWMYARSGDFENAVRWQEKALELPIFAINGARGRLEKYRQRRADVDGVFWSLVK